MGLVNVTEWVDIFKTVGLSEEDMNQWHRVFEKCNPEGHISFLKWLGLSEKEVEKVRHL